MQIICCGCSNGTESEQNNLTNNIPKIFWELNWLSQWDPKLIQFIKENVLIPPPRVKQSLILLNEFSEKQPWTHQGTHGEALAVESIYGLKDRTKIMEIRKSKENCEYNNI